MRFHYKGTFSGNEEDLPKRDPMPAGAVMFREPKSTGQTAVIAGVISVVLLLPLMALLAWRSGTMSVLIDGGFYLALVLSLVAAVPHEFLHAMWFREDVYMYSNIKQGMLFVVGPEDMSKGRFIWMSFFPALVLGVIPICAFLINPALRILGVFGAFSFVYASGDFINIFNAATQMPAGARTFLSGLHSYWYK